MKVDELRRGLDGTGRLNIDLVEARAAVGAKSAHRRRRNRLRAGVAVIAAVAAVTTPIVLRAHDPKGSITVAPTPADEVVNGWTLRSKEAAGLDANASFSALSISGHSPYSLLLAELHYRQPTIWYSEHWRGVETARVPAATTGAAKRRDQHGERNRVGDRHRRRWIRAYVRVAERRRRTQLECCCERRWPLRARRGSDGEALRFGADGRLRDVDRVGRRIERIRRGVDVK